MIGHEWRSDILQACTHRPHQALLQLDYTACQLRLLREQLAKYHHPLVLQVQHQHWAPHI